LYNTGDREYRAGMELVDSVADALVQRDDHPDIVIGSYLGNKTTAPLLADLEPALRNVDAGHFYPSLLEAGAFEEAQRLLPVSFNLPGVMFADTAANADLPAFALSMEEVRDAGGAFNRREEERFVRMGFSPRWNTSFFYTAARLLNVGFHEEEERYAEWDERALSRTVSFLQQWTERTNGGLDGEENFQEQYLYDPPYELLQRQRIRFSFLSSREFFDFTEEQRDALALRWIHRNDRVPVGEDMTMAGIPAEARNRQGARDFLAWFYTPATQEQLLEMVVSKQLETFGIADGFAAFPEVNELIFPELYPSLLGKVPPERMLWVPNRVPKNWDAIKEDVVRPWLGEAVADGVDQSDLEERMRSWVLQKGE
jgi:hypothetical protein